MSGQPSIVQEPSAPQFEHVSTASIVQFYEDWASKFRIYVSPGVAYIYAKLLKDKLHTRLWGEICERAWMQHSGTHLPPPDWLLIEQSIVTELEPEDGEGSR